MVNESDRSRPLEILVVFLRLGLTSFGGPVAHLAYFRQEFIDKRRWFDEAGFADLLALAQFLPGPASSEFGFAVGLLRAGLPGALCAWLGFTLPSALIMGGLGYGIARLGDLAGAPWLHGLMLVACAVVALAVWQMARRLANDVPRGAVALVAAALTLMLPATWGQLAAIGFGAAAGRLFLPGDTRHAALPFVVRVPRRLAIAALIAFALLLTLPPLVATASNASALQLFDGF